MKLRDKRLGIFLSTVMLFTIAACILRTVALKLDFNPDSGYFTKQTLISTATVPVILAILCSVLYIFAGKTRKDIKPDFHGAATYIPSGLLALALAFFTANTAFNSNFGSEKPSYRLLIILTVISALATIVYLLLNSLLGRRYSEVRGAAALAPIILLLTCASRLYFDKAMPINAPNKSIDVLAFIFAMLFFTAEARLSLGREKWGAYIPLGLCAASLTAYASIPAILIYFISGTEGNALTVSTHITSSVFIFTLFVFIISRITLTAFLTATKEGSLAAYIAANKKEQDENSYIDINNEYQISIDDIINEEDQAGNEVNE